MSAEQRGADVETDHEYDGIREFDNPLPRWWLLTLYGTVVFSVGYWFYYHTLGAGPTLAEELKEEVQAAAAADEAREAEMLKTGQLGEEQLTALGKDEGAVGRGKATYVSTCQACHGDKGQGVIGPNLTDAYWINGDKAVDVYKVIASGVQEKGMPAWKPVLGSKKVKEVLAYVLSIRNQNIAGKPPQGKDAAGKPAP